MIIAVATNSSLRTLATSKGPTLTRLKVADAIEKEVFGGGGGEGRTSFDSHGTALKILYINVCSVEIRTRYGWASTVATSELFYRRKGEFNLLAPNCFVLSVPECLISCIP